MHACETGPLFVPARWLGALLPLLLLLAGPAAAAPDTPVAVTLPPVGEGAVFSPGIRLVGDLVPEYIEEEFFVEGVADVYSYEDPPVRGEVVVLEAAVPYKTRFIVRRPADGKRFNGTVVIEWWNTTSTFDVAPVWDPSAEYFAREGIVYIGFTNANQGMSHLTSGCRLFGILPPTCGTRYASLSMPDDGLAYDIASQLATLVKSDSDQNPLPEGYKVRQVLHAGQSQQGGSMIAYANNFHTEVNDGYFVQSATRSRSVCGTGGSLPDGCIPQLDDAAERLVRRDLPVPVYRGISENDAARGATVQEDQGLFRYYEIAGTSHVTVHEGVELLPAGLLGPDPLLLEDACLFPVNSTGDGPVFGSHMYNAMWHNMQETVRSGKPAPQAPALARGPQGDIVRDVFGNAVGGISPTSIQVPIARYEPLNQPDAANLPGPLLQLGQLFCFLAGAVEPLDDATLAALYPKRWMYVADVKAAALGLHEDGFLLIEDAKREIQMAAESSVGSACGLGFELVLILPPLLVAHGRRRRRAASEVRRDVVPEAHVAGFRSRERNGPHTS